MPPAAHASVPALRIVIVTGYVRPAAIEVGMLCETNAASSEPEPTAMGTFGVAAPK